MNNIIKCPICGKNSAMRYNEKSIYESRCLYSECREVITVTAKSEVAAKELFAKFGSSNHPKLSIPKKIADLADKEAYADPHTKFKMFIERYELGRFDDKLNLYCCSEDGRETAFAYINPLTRHLVKVVEDE